MKKRTIAIFIMLALALSGVAGCKKKVETQPGQPEPTIEEKRAAIRLELGKLARGFESGKVVAGQIRDLAEAFSKVTPPTQANPNPPPPILAPDKAKNIIAHANNAERLLGEIATGLQKYADTPPSERISISNLLNDLKDAITEARTAGLLNEVDPERANLIRLIFAGAVILLPILEAQFTALDLEVAALWPK